MLGQNRLGPGALSWTEQPTTSRSVGLCSGLRPLGLGPRAPFARSDPRPEDEQKVQRTPRRFSNHAGRLLEVPGGSYMSGQGLNIPTSTLRLSKAAAAPSATM